MEGFCLTKMRSSAVAAGLHNLASCMSTENLVKLISQAGNMADETI